MKKIILSLVTLTLLSQAFSQTCNCLQEYQWIKKTFEDNDAGYPYYIQKYGATAIQANNIKWEKEFVATTDITKCQTSLNNWIKFYRKGHIGIGLGEQIKISPKNTTQLPPVTTNTKVSSKYYDSAFLKTYLDNKKQTSFEGIWTNGTYKLGIVKVDSLYVGFIISSKNSSWKQGETKFYFPVDTSQLSKSVYYMGDHSPSEKTVTSINLVGKSYLNAFDIY